MLIPEDISKMKESPPYAAGMKALMKAKEGQSISLQKFSDAQDLVIVKLAMLVGSQPAPLENATIEDYETAKESGENNKRSKAGPASLGMDKELQDLTDIYVKKYDHKQHKRGWTSCPSKQMDMPSRETPLAEGQTQLGVCLKLQIPNQWGNTFEHVLSELKLSIVTGICCKSKGPFKTSTDDLWNSALFKTMFCIIILENRSLQMNKNHMPLKICMYCKNTMFGSLEVLPFLILHITKNTFIPHAQMIKVYSLHVYNQHFRDPIITNAEKATKEHQAVKNQVVEEKSASKVRAYFKFLSGT